MTDDAKPDLLSLNDQQQKAYSDIRKFLAVRLFDSAQFFVLSGYAGTGKTFLLRALLPLLKEQFGLASVAFTAPTNKATKVIKKTLAGHYGPTVKTIYSLLGIKMVANSEELVLEFPRIPVSLNAYPVIFVDEASMINRELFKYIVDRAQAGFTKWIFIGDPAQLNPVGESKSKVWTCKCGSAHLEEVMRFDNELLETATHIRKQIQNFPDYRLRLRSNHGAKRGVWKYDRVKFVKGIERAAQSGLFSKTDHSKIIAWRNKTVNEYNQIVRRQIFNTDARFVVGDRVILREPVQIGRDIVAHVDDEGTVTSAGIAYHALYPSILCHHLTVKLDGSNTVTLRVVHDDSAHEFQESLNRLALEAKVEHSKWKYFWALKNSFHSVLYAYALTAHRSQGSSFKNVFLDVEDILSNTNEFEALRCLYVGATRATTRLILF